MSVCGKTLPGAPEPLTDQEKRFKALHETLLVTADVALEAGEDRVAELLQSLAGQGSLTVRLLHFQMAARRAAQRNPALGPEHYVSLNRVFDLLKFFALGAPPDGLPADPKVPRPTWYDKAVVRQLILRGWRPMDGYVGMYRNDVYIPAADIRAIEEDDAAAVLLLERMARQDLLL